MGLGPPLLFLVGPSLLSFKFRILPKYRKLSNTVGIVLYKLGLYSGKAKSFNEKDVAEFWQYFVHFSKLLTRARSFGPCYCSYIFVPCLAFRVHVTGDLNKTIARNKRSHGFVR